MIVPMLLSVLSITSGKQAFAAQIFIQGERVGAYAGWQGPAGQLRDIQLVVAKDSLSATTGILLIYDTPFMFGAHTLLTTTADVFHTGGFNIATLSPVTLNVCLADDEFGKCLQPVPVTIQASWTGFGALVHSAGHPTLGNPDKVGFLQLSGMDRSAAATGILNGQSLGRSPFADTFNTEGLVIYF
jgi:hypothetical protein